jgi:hypothetical protein
LHRGFPRRPTIGVLDLARSDATDHNGGADHVSMALLAFGSRGITNVQRIAPTGRTKGGQGAAFLPMIAEALARLMPGEMME